MGLPAKEPWHDPDVVGDVEVREQTDALEDVADAAAQLVGVAGRDVATVDPDRTGDHDFVDIEGSLKPKPRHRTRMKMLWDDEYFYVGAEMEDPHVWATLTEKNSFVFNDPDFEVFIDPDGDSHLYTEIELNAFNTVWDLLLVRPYRDGGPAIHAWDIPGLRTAVHQAHRAWDSLTLVATSASTSSSDGAVAERR